jgi:hypothetical protein
MLMHNAFALTNKMNFLKDNHHKPNLILGYAVGLTQDQIRFFCESATLSATTRTDIVLFGREIQPIEVLSPLVNMMVIPTPNIWQGVTKDTLRLRWACAYFSSTLLTAFTVFGVRIFRRLFGSQAFVTDFRSNWIHPALSRYIVYYNFLSANAHLYQTVLISDVRDVYFQRDPFHDFNQKFVTFLEIEGSSCGGRTNRRWIKSVYGKKVAASMSDKRVICSGISMGTSLMMRDYLSQMRHEVTRLGCIPYADQGIHNVLIRKNSFPASLCVNEDGLTLTAAGEGSAKDFLLEDDVVVTQKRKPFALVHQYDRYTSLREALAKQHARRIYALGR